MEQLVSILIPAFNAEKWIGKCIKSALNQTWRRKEIIVVDDGSMDSTFEIAKSYASPEALVMTQGNQGACAARNFALSLAQGDYIQWLDADDLIAPDKIEKQIEDAESGLISDIIMSCAWGFFYICPSKTRFIPNSLWETLDPVEWLFRKIDRNEWMAPETWLVSRKLTEQAGPWNEKLARDQDGEYFCRVLKEAKQVRFFPEARVFKRAGIGGSISSDTNLSGRKLESILISVQLHVKTLLAAENSMRTRRACLRLLDRWTIYLYPERTDLLDRMQSMANDLGGQLSPPRLRRKYRWLQMVFGWRIAKKAQIALPNFRSLAEKNWERVLCFRSARKRARYSRT